MSASQRGHKVTVQALLEAGADLSIQDKVADAQTLVLFNTNSANLHYMVTVAEQQDRRRMGQDPRDRGTHRKLQ
jgi:hypothetical protein